MIKNTFLGGASNVILRSHIVFLSLKGQLLVHWIELFVLTLSGAVYTIWGKKGCPTVTGTKTIYSGIYHFNMYHILNVLFISRRWRRGGGIFITNHLFTCISKGQQMQYYFLIKYTSWVNILISNACINNCLSSLEL